MNAPARIPVSVITGFLGSGKTTILTQLLVHPDLRRTVVLVNELGEIGIDDMLLREVAPNVVLLESGCICCTVGDDLTARLLELLAQRDAGTIPPFERAIIETTGLADSAPLMHSIMRGPLAAAPFRLGGVITTVDAVNGAGQLDRHAESVKQAALADRLLVTKCDLADARSTDALMQRLRQINATAPVHPVSHARVDPQAILDAGLWNPATHAVDVDRWLNDGALVGAYRHRTGRGRVIGTAGRHDPVATFALTREAALPLTAVIDTIERLISRFGDRLLRVKGIIHVEGTTTPVVVHGVQQIFHPPVRLPAWPSADRRSRLVVIARDIDTAELEAELRPLLESTALQ